MSLEQIIHDLEAAEVAVETVLDASLAKALGTSLVPESVAHYFACDCAARVALRESAAGKAVDARGEAAVEAKRAWLEQRGSLEALKQAHLEASQCAQQVEEQIRLGQNASIGSESLRRVAFYSAATAAQASMPKPYDAARSTVRFALLSVPVKRRSKEMDWMRRRLAWLSSLFLFAGDRWFVLAPGGATPHPCPEEILLNARL